MEERLSLEQTLDSDVTVAALCSDDASELLAHFKRVSLTSGRAVYDWTPDSGLYRLGAEHILIPRTRQPADVLAYIASSRHFGVYLLRGMGGCLKKAPIQRLVQKINGKNDGVRRLVLLVDDQVEIPEGLHRVVRRIVHRRRPTAVKAG